ncbi:MAG: hypothetical protein HY885_13760 [Deltaproteobacteria bacterium]|nr:hypothetical protein [Deltaproteobacteria bacterium]
MEKNIFKACPSCGKKWQDYNQLLADPATCVIGYQVCFASLREGLFLFNHTCGTTLAIPVGALQHLYDGPLYQERLDNSEKCQGMCLNQHDTEPCPAKCECAYAREILQIVKGWPKAGHSHL